MKNISKKMLYLLIIILIIIIGILVGIIINRNNIINKKEESKEQLTTTTSSNAYVTTEAHLSEISEQEQKLSYTLPEMRLGHSYNSAGTSYPSYVCLPLRGINYVSYYVTAANGYSYITIEYLNSLGETVLLQVDNVNINSTVEYKYVEEKFDVSEYDYIKISHKAKNNNSNARITISDFIAE